MTRNPEYQEKCKKMLAVIESKKKFLFTDRDFITVADYIKFFEENYKLEFFPFPSMFPYKTSILDKYSKFVYNSSYLPLDASGNLLFHTIIQFSKTFHGLFVYGHMDDDGDDIAIFTTLYSTNQLNCIDFIKDNKEFVIEKEKPLGFQMPAGLPVGFGS